MQITYKKKIIRNLGNYENVTIEIEVLDNVNYERDETYESVYEKLRSCVSKSLNEESRIISEKLKNRGIK